MYIYSNHYNGTSFHTPIVGNMDF